MAAARAAALGTSARENTPWARGRAVARLGGPWTTPRWKTNYGREGPGRPRVGEHTIGDGGALHVKTRHRRGAGPPRARARRFGLFCMGNHAMGYGNGRGAGPLCAGKHIMGEGQGRRVR
eukprot:2768994-Pyramimonas_sp.AAC.1